MKNIKITAISDTHTKHDSVELPGGDILIHAGDLTWLGQPDEVEKSLSWLSKQDYKYKIFIAGNHDLGFEPFNEGIEPYKSENDKYFYRFRSFTIEKNLEAEYRKYADIHGLIYLKHELVVIDGLRIFGSPYQPEFCNWAFNYAREGNQAKELWNGIPENLDILITHGPPLNILDKVRDPFADNRCGCPVLRKAVNKKKPKHHVFGHLHESYGTKKLKHTTFYNVAICTRDYIPSNKPISFTISI